MNIGLKTNGKKSSSQTSPPLKQDGTRGSEYMPEFIQRVAASGRSAVSVWGAITFQGLGPLVRIEGRFNADSYYSILDDVLLPYLVEGPTFPDNEFILQHDNSPIHKARKGSTAISTSVFYSVPKERPKRFVHANLLDVIDTNESDFSADERSEDEVSGDSSDEEEAVSTEVEEAEAEVASLTDMPPGDRKSRNVKKRYTWVKKDVDNEAESSENDFPLPRAGPLSA
ncbi:hypothetical protein HPB49_004675 [Dermacentor silvarum]|uniref:Uncharacterized protein n=1 Tax=Dermacentor silvarum TaxID=543639 RepID=A0ACB8C248_DERSI|nr:hypothetical protein HPB49_004675 [Dermacentor silvarum]